mmetsp:Transcript_161183/g.517431  ORF Transcript_161183/g.517431 Transcript_161183/m.517431 type:complete len:403 (+) Transcript_161183:1354-2562(+)
MAVHCSDRRGLQGEDTVERLNEPLPGNPRKSARLAHHCLGRQAPQRSLAGRRRRRLTTQSHRVANLQQPRRFHIHGRLHDVDQGAWRIFPRSRRDHGLRELAEVGYTLSEQIRAVLGHAAAGGRVQAGQPGAEGGPGARRAGQRQVEVVVQPAVVKDDVSRHLDVNLLLSRYYLLRTLFRHDNQRNRLRGAAAPDGNRHHLLDTDQVDYDLVLGPRMRAHHLVRGVVDRHIQDAAEPDQLNGLDAPRLKLPRGAVAGAVRLTQGACHAFRHAEPRTRPTRLVVGLTSGLLLVRVLYGVLLNGPAGSLTSLEGHVARRPPPQLGQKVALRQRRQCRAADSDLVHLRVEEDLSLDQEVRFAAARHQHLGKQAHVGRAHVQDIGLRVSLDQRRLHRHCCSQRRAQ